MLQRVKADRVIYFRPGGGKSPGIAAAAGWSSEWVDRLTAHAGKAGIELLRVRGESLELGPFGEQNIWPRPEAQRPADGGRRKRRHARGDRRPRTIAADEPLVGGLSRLDRVSPITPRPAGGKRRRLRKLSRRSWN